MKLAIQEIFQSEKNLHKYGYFVFAKDLERPLETFCDVSSTLWVFLLIQSQFKVMKDEERPKTSLIINLCKFMQIRYP